MYLRSLRINLDNVLIHFNWHHISDLVVCEKKIYFDKNCFIQYNPMMSEHFPVADLN